MLPFFIDNQRKKEYNINVTRLSYEEIMPNQTFFNLSETKQERIMAAIIKEMGARSYEHINLSNIIKDASIPRGSFYQYFKDKDDMYQYFYTYIAKLKMAYWSDTLDPNRDVPFLERFKDIYMLGYRFAYDYPDLVKVGQKIITSDFLQNSELAKKSYEMTKTYYANYIIKDQEMGRIREDIDPYFVSTLLIDFMNKLSLNEYLNDSFDFKHIEEHIAKLIDLLKKGIS
jgi:AcrR family transcriptional regulator